MQPTHFLSLLLSSDLQVRELIKRLEKRCENDRSWACDWEIDIEASDFKNYSVIVNIELDERALISELTKTVESLLNTASRCGLRTVTELTDGTHQEIEVCDVRFELVRLFDVQVIQSGYAKDGLDLSRL